jgi:hypothetical protein
MGAAARRENSMATSRKTPSKDTTAKATAAGPKRRAGGKRAAQATPEAKTPAHPPAEARPHLRAVATTAPDASPAPDSARADKATDGAEAETAGDTGAETRFKRNDLIEAVTQRSKLKKSEAKLVVELVLEELGRALDRTEELVVPPLGKLSVKRRKPDADGPAVLTIKLRRPGPSGAKGDESPLADPDEDG